MSRPSLLITAAAAGIGLATARLFIRNGWFVGLYDIDTSKLDELRSALDPECPLIEELDVRETKAWHQALERFHERTDARLDVLFNNAGVVVVEPIFKWTYRDRSSWTKINQAMSVKFIADHAKKSRFVHGQPAFPRLTSGLDKPQTPDKTTPTAI